MSWITHADGTVEPEIHLPIDDLIEFDGSIIDEIKHFKQKYIKSLNRGEKLKRLLAKRLKLKKNLFVTHFRVASLE